MPTDERSLWTAWRQRRDGEAFAQLVRPEIRHAADHARRLGATPDEADDAAQASLLRLAEAADDEPIEVGLRAWLCRRAALAFRMHVRGSARRRRRERIVAAARPEAGGGPAPDLRDQVESALARLDADERAAVTLRYVQDLEYTAVAHVLGISVNAARVRVHRAIARLRTELGAEPASLVAHAGLAALPAESAWISAAIASAGGGTVAAASSAAAAGATTAAAAKPFVPVVAALALGAAAAVVGYSASRPADVATAPRPHRAPTAPVPPAPRDAPAPSEPAPPVPSAPVPEALPPLPDAIAAADVFDLLDRHFSDATDAAGTLWRFDTIAALVPSVGGPALRVDDPGGGAVLDLTRIAESHRRVELGPGTFRIERGFPRDVAGAFEIRGAGSDVTTIHAPSGALLLARSGRATLRLSDVAFDGALPADRTSGSAFDARSDGSAALFERVHFRRWRRTAGYAAPTGVTGRAALAFRDCRFSAPDGGRADGSALAVRGAVLALFDACTFEGLETTVAAAHGPASSPRSVVHFLGCTFRDAPLADTRWIHDGTAAAIVRVRGGTVSLPRGAGAHGDPLAGWGGAFAAEVVGVTVER